MSLEKPSRTACKVALNILTLGAKPDMAAVLPSGIVEATENLLVASDAASMSQVYWSRLPVTLSLYMAFDWMMPGQFEAFAYRKRFFEDQVRQAIDKSTNQVLVLGGGYDTLAWRLAVEYPDVDFFEIDHPSTSLLKARGIEKMGARANFHLIAEDLSTHKLDDVLASVEKWDRSRKTIIMAEGLLQYLPPSAVDELFEQCTSVAQISTFVFTFVTTREDGEPDAGPWSWLVLWLLKREGEPWLWSVRPEELGSFLEERGWTYAPELVGKTTRHGVEFYGAAAKG
ncbi:MAG: SAM-dependent methyltransferase [Desulfocapsaceae bacterium]|nr:SAM-dependent methyltransferase [Desulfocapsaceae bacterium]